MDTSVELVKQAFEHRSPGRPPRGELWLGTDLLHKANLEDDLEGHLRLIQRLGHDILCLPLSDESAANTALSYRYFNVQELAEASRVRDLFVMALIDGPFQRLAEQRGLLKLLAGWRRERDDCIKAYEEEGRAVAVLIKRCLEWSVDAIVIADDVAGDRAPLVSLDDIQDLFAPFYTRAVSAIHSGGAYALLHSCGNITRLIPQLISSGFDGLAAVQHRTNDLIAVKEQWGDNLALMAGIEAETLEVRELSSSSRQGYERLIQSLAQGGGFVICSSSGLYSGEFLERIQELYRIADRLFES
jgi:uroporphyrinogen-III decarboxylase